MSPFRLKYTERISSTFLKGSLFKGIHDHSRIFLPLHHEVKTFRWES